MSGNTAAAEGSTSNAISPNVWHAQWPLQVVEVEKLGYIVDSNGNSYPRDIGRSSVIADGAVVFQFGDTFAHDAEGKFVGSTSSSAAVVRDPANRPTVATYGANADGTIPAFIPLLEVEEDDDRTRATLRCCGGIIELDDSDGRVAAGWAFYQKATHHHRYSGDHILEYTGAVKVYYNLETRCVTARRWVQPIVLFNGNEPGFGTFSAVREGEMAYLFGHAPSSTKVMLARSHVQWVLARNRYTYWDGKKYQADLDKAKPIMDDVHQGAIYHSKLFEAHQGRDWVFVGNSRFYDSQVLFGVAPRLEGPYTMVNLIQAYPLIPMPNTSYCNCIFPHPWAFKEEDGQLMITWSEGTAKGGVVAVKVQFAMIPDVGKPAPGMRPKKTGSGEQCVVS